MRQFVTLVTLLLFSVPVGLSISGCSKHTPATFCSAGDGGVVEGQVTTLTLNPEVYGISLNQGQIGSTGTPSATDCKSQPVSVRTFTYNSSDMTLADINPANGALCGGSWNRNSPNGIADYTYCTSTGRSGTAFITASAEGASSNPLPVFVHPVVSSIVLGAPSTNCATDTATNCCPFSTTGTVTQPTTTYTGMSCLSQGQSGQIAARVFAGTGSTQTNITCQLNNGVYTPLVGHLSYTPQTSSIVTIDENGVAVANQPGSTIITANLGNAASAGGFFATCPPASITLSAPGASNGGLSVNQNTTQSFTASAVDTNGKQLTGLSYTYVSTTPLTLPASGNGTVTPTFPGAGAVYAVCEPPTCNSSPINQIGLFGNGTPTISNNLQVTTPGTSSSYLYAASTQSQYIEQIDLTTRATGTPVKLPVVPDSMVISQDGSVIYLGSSTELMIYSAIANSVSSTNAAVIGQTLAVSPDGTTLVIANTARNLIYLYNTSSNAIVSSYAGTATRAAYSADGQTMYALSGNQLIVYSTQIGWATQTLATAGTDIVPTVPNVGAYIGGSPTLAVGYCPRTTVNSGGLSTTNTYYPQADQQAVATDRLAATNDGLHILGGTAVANTGTTITDLRVTLPIGACPQNGLTFTSVPTQTIDAATKPTAITAVVPTSNSAIAAITYTGTGGVLPMYAPVNSGQGTLTNVALSGTATAPVAGVWSVDNTTFFTGTSGDNLIHLITRATLTDTSTLAPNLPAATGTGFAVPNLMAQRPRAAQ
jgi:hypothetical protein